MFQRYAKIQVVAVCVAAAWLILFGVALAEGLGLYRDTPEDLDDGMEQVLSSDVITEDSVSDIVRIVHLFIAAVAFLPVLHTLYVNPRLSISIGERIARTTKDLELYRLYSTYLI